MNSAVSPGPLGERIVRHAKYYIPGGDVVFRVENMLFRVHRYFFTRDSTFFREKLPHPPPPGEFSKGSSDNNPFILEDTLKEDFENLLWIFYNEKYNIYEASVAEWSSILKLSHQWDFNEVKAFALRELEEQEIPALQKILLYHAYEIDRNLLQAAYTALTVRDESITIEEGRVLGLETALRLAHAREIARAPVFTGKKAGTPRSPINLQGSELDALINRLFNLSVSDAASDRPPTPQTPTRRGTPNGGRDTPQLGIHTNGTGSTVSTPVRGGSVVQTGSTATQMDTSMAARANNEGAGKVEGLPNVPESNGKEAVAEVVSVGHRPEPAATQSRTNDSETKKITEAQGAPSTSKSEKGQGSTRKREIPEQSSSAVRPERTRAQSEQIATTTPALEVRSERSRSRTAEPTKNEQLQINTTASASERRRRDTTPTPTRESSSTLPLHHKKSASSTTTPAASTSGLFGFVSTWMGNSGDPGYESSSRESEDDTPMAGAWRSRDHKARQERLERQERERVEAETRAQAQEAARQRLEAEAAKARADADEKAREEAEERAREEAEAAEARADAEKAREEAEERTRKEAEEAKARADAEKARKDAEIAEAAKAKADANKARKEAKAAKALEDAEKARKEAEEKTRKEAEEKARKAEEKKEKRAARLKAKADEVAKARAEAEKAEQEAEAKAKAEAEEAEKREAEAKAKAEAEEVEKREAEAKAQADAEKAKQEDEAKAKADFEKAEREAEAKAKEADAEKAKQEADAKAKADAEKAEHDAEAEKAMRDAEAKAETEKAERDAEAKAEAEKIERDTEAKAKEAEAEAKRAEAETLKAAQEAEAKATTEAKLKAEAEIKAKAEAETARKAEEEAEAKAKAELEAKEKTKAAEAKATADAEAKKKAEAEKAEQEAATRAAIAEQKRLDKERIGDLVAKQAEEKIAKQRAADRAVRAAASSASSPMSPARSSGGGWFTKFSSAASGVVSAIVASDSADDPRSPLKLTGTGGSPRRPAWGVPSPSAEYSPRGNPVLQPPTVTPSRPPASSLSVASGTTVGSSSSVVSSTTTLVSQQPNTTKVQGNPWGKQGGTGKHSQAQPAPVIAAAPPAGQVAGDEAKNQPADVVIKKQPTSDAVEVIQAIDGATPNPSGDQSTSNSSEVDTAPTHQASPAIAVTQPELGQDPVPLVPPSDASAPPPLPEKDVMVTNKPTPTAEESPASSSQTAQPTPSKDEDANKTSEPPAPAPKPEAAAAAKVDSSETDAAKDEPVPQSSADGEGHTIDEGSANTQDDNGKPDGAAKPVLRIDRIRELSTASSMSGTTSTPGTPADETASSAVEGDDSGTPKSATPLSRNQKKSLKKKLKKKGEKNSPQLPSKETVNVVDNSTVQERKSVDTAPDDIPEGEGELVEKVDSREDPAVIVDKEESGGEDPAVIVTVEKSQTEPVKTADDSGSDEWLDF